MIGKVTVTSSGYNPDDPRAVHDPTLGPDFPGDVTIGDKYGPAMSITDQAAADAYFERCVRHTMRVGGLGREEAEQVERQNLGYWAGYYDHETRARVERLFRCAHPVFGAIAEKGPPTPEEAYRLGLEMGRPMQGVRALLGVAPMTHFARNLKRIRIERGLTQVELSRRIGKSSCVVAQYESGHRSPGLANLTKLALTLGVSVEAISGQAPAVPGLTGPLADRLVAAFSGLTDRDREIVVRLAESLSTLS